MQYAVKPAVSLVRHVFMFGSQGRVEGRHERFINIVTGVETEFRRGSSVRSAEDSVLQSPGSVHGAMGHLPHGIVACSFWTE